MCIPLPKLVKGVPGYEIAEEIGFLACELLDRGVPAELIDRRLEAFHAAPRGKEVTRQRLCLVLDYAYHWVSCCAREAVTDSPARHRFLDFVCPSQHSLQALHDAAEALQSHTLSSVGPDVDHATPLERGLAEALGDLIRAINAAAQVSRELNRGYFRLDALAEGVTPQPSGGPSYTMVIQGTKPLSPLWMNPIGIHFADCAGQAASCGAEYFAPDASYVNREDHEPYHRQWERCSLEILDMIVALKMPSFTDPEYFPRAVAPSLDHFRAIRGEKSLSPTGPFRSRTPERF